MLDQIRIYLNVYRLDNVIKIIASRNIYIYIAMGTCCFGNRPSEKFVGIWTDNKYVQLTINESGNIIYQKQV